MRRRSRVAGFLAAALAAVTCAVPATDQDESGPPSPTGAATGSPSPGRSAAITIPPTLTPRPTPRAEFPLTFLEPFSENTPPGTTGYRFVVGTGVAPEGANALRARLPDGCRTQRPLNCTWQIVFTGSPLTVELFVPSDFPAGEYVFGFTLQDGRSADTVFSVSPPPSLTSVAAGSPSPGRSAAITNPGDATPRPIPLPTLASQPSAPAASATAPARPFAPTATPEARVEPIGALHLTRSFPGPGSELSQSGTADAAIAIGMTEVIVTANDVMGIYGKDGRIIHVALLTELFRPVLSATEGVGDSRVVFDRRAARYFLTTSSHVRGPRCRPYDACANQWILAVSKTSSPRRVAPDDWYIFAFDGRSEDGRLTATFGDFTLVSFDDATVLLVGQRLTENNEQFVKIWMFEKQPLLSGVPVAQPAREFSHIVDPLTGQPVPRLLPALSVEPPPAHFLVQHGSGCNLVVAGVQGTATSPEIRVQAVRADGRCGVAGVAPQRGAADLVQNDVVVSSPAFHRGGLLWVAYPERRDYPSGAVTGIRLAVIDVRAWPNAPTLVEDRIFSEENVWYSFPALVLSDRGDLALVTTRSSSADFPSVFYTGRLVGDAAGSFRPPAPLKRGVGPFIGCSSPRPDGTSVSRFADYSGAALDPSDGSAWIVGEYSAGGVGCAWGTWVGRIDWSAN